MPQIRVDENNAIRLIARVLRDDGKLSPADANSIASTIMAGLKAAETSKTKPGLAHHRLIPSYPSTATVAKIVRSERFKLAEDDVWWLWKLVYDEGQDPPSDVDMTNF
jgi:hypothetical protein